DHGPDAGLLLLQCRVVQELALAAGVDAADAPAGLVIRELRAGDVAVLLALLRFLLLRALFLRRVGLLLLALAERLLLLGRRLSGGPTRPGRRRGRRVAPDGGRGRAGGARHLRVHGVAAFGALVDLC